jgi:hypothetical protein
LRLCRQQGLEERQGHIIQEGNKTLNFNHNQISLLCVRLGLEQAPLASAV